MSHSWEYFYLLTFLGKKKECLVLWILSIFQKRSLGKCSHACLQVRHGGALSSRRPTWCSLLAYVWPLHHFIADSLRKGTVSCQTWCVLVLWLVTGLSTWKLLSKYLSSRIVPGTFRVFENNFFFFTCITSPRLSTFPKTVNTYKTLSFYWLFFGQHPPWHIHIDLKISFYAEAGCCTPAMAFVLGESPCFDSWVAVGETQVSEPFSEHLRAQVALAIWLGWLSTESSWQPSCLPRGHGLPCRDTLSAWHQMLGGCQPEQGRSPVPHSVLG